MLGSEGFATFGSFGHSTSTELFLNFSRTFIIVLVTILILIITESDALGKRCYMFVYKFSLFVTYERGFSFLAKIVIDDHEEIPYKEDLKYI